MNVFITKHQVSIIIVSLAIIIAFLAPAMMNDIANSKEFQAHLSNNVGTINAVSYISDTEVIVWMEGDEDEINNDLEIIYDGTDLEITAISLVATKDAQLYAVCVNY